MEKEEIMLQARGESNDSFQVTFTRDEGKLTITCNCPEGRHGEFCEHKFRLASNDLMALQYPRENSAMLNAHVWVIESALSDNLLKLLTLQSEKEPDEKAIDDAKAEIGTAMREGTVSSA